MARISRQGQEGAASKEDEEANMAVNSFMSTTWFNSPLRRGNRRLVSPLTKRSSN